MKKRISVLKKVGRFIRLMIYGLFYILVTATMAVLYLLSAIIKLICGDVDAQKLTDTVLDILL